MKWTRTTPEEPGLYLYAVADRSEVRLARVNRATVDWIWTGFAYDSIHSRISMSKARRLKGWWVRVEHPDHVLAEWRTERVFFTRSEGEAYGKARAYNYTEGWRVCGHVPGVHAIRRGKAGVMTQTPTSAVDAILESR